MSSVSPNRLKDAEHLPHPADVSNGCSTPRIENRTQRTSEGENAQISAEELTALRREKLDDIRKAIDAGAYDSDELLNESMRRMRDAIENEE